MHPKRKTVPIYQPKRTGGKTGKQIWKKDQFCSALACSIFPLILVGLHWQGPASGEGDDWVGVARPGQLGAGLNL